MTAIRQAVILVGGKGTRLGTLTAETPKPILPIGKGVRFLDILIRNVARQGFSDIVLIAGYLGEQIADLYDKREFCGAQIRVLVEPEPMGTAGAIAYARDILADRFLMMNGDCIFDFNLRAFAAQSGLSHTLATIAVRPVPDGSRYGTVTLEGGLISSFREKDPSSRSSALINGGVYCLDRRIIDRIPSLPASIEQDVFPALARDGALGGIEYSGYFLDIGLPETLDQGRRELLTLERRPAAFLDRDGVLNRDHGYVHKPDQVDWVPGAADAVKRLNDEGYYVFVVTNQAGIARGYYDETTMHELHSWMSDRLAEKGAFIDAFYYCPYHPEGVVPAFTGHHPDRKPGSGMIERALREWPADRSRSFLIGDQNSDIEAAARAGIPGFKFEASNLREFLEITLHNLDERDSNLR